MQMRTFLEETAHSIVEQHGADLEDICLVVPGRRAGVYLRQSLGTTLGKPVIAPRILTLPGFFAHLTGIQPLPKLSLLFRLYECHRELHATPEPFAHFLKWAPTALDDFSDLDHAMVEPASFFRDLKSIREIDQWSFSLDPLSDAQISFSAFWDTLGPLYAAFSQTTPQTLSYAQVVRGLAENRINFSENALPRYTWFIGLSSLTPAESAVVSGLAKQGKANTRWDLDEWYCLQPDHSAGQFYRQSLRKENLVLSTAMAETDRELHVHACTTSQGQVWGAHEQLRTMTPEALNRTAVVIMDNRLVGPFLSELPELPVKVNVATGLSMRGEGVFRLVDSLLTYQLRLHANPEKVYHPLLLNVLQNPVTQNLTGIPPARLSEWIARGVRVYIRAEDHDALANIFPHYNAFANRWLRTPINADSFIAQAILLAREIYESGSTSNTGREAAKKLHALLLETGEYLSKHTWLKTMDSIAPVIRQLIAGETITYAGEPLNGLQVLTMVETRAVDFDYVFVLGANEDLLPQTGHYQSLFPFELRKYHGLPMPSDRESTYSYTFYRLIQRCRRADLFYSQISADFKGTEQSRYITQLEFETKVRPSRMIIRRHQVYQRSTTLPMSFDGLQANSFSRDRIKSWMQRGISPSSLGTYLRCPQDFYYKYILGLREKTELEESISVSTFGSVVHLVMEHFMQAFDGNFPGTEDWIEFRESLDSRIKEACAEAAAGHDFSTGFNHIQFDVMKAMIEKLIRFEEQTHNGYISEGLSHTVSTVEETLRATLPSSAHPFDWEVVLTGKADRIDLVGGKPFIIDYKTGSVKNAGKGTSKNDETWFTSQNDKLIQILSYAYMYGSRDGGKTVVNAGLLSLREIDLGYFDLKEFQENNPDWREKFEQQLGELLIQIAEASHFPHHPQSSYCEFCNTL